MEDARARRRAGDLDPASFATAGAHLKAVREASGLSLEEVSERTHIKASFLGAIEEMKLSALPSRPFAVGFVKVFAESLGLDPAVVVARFKEDAGLAAPAEVEPERFEQAQRAVETERPEMSLLAVAGVTLFILWCAFQIATSTHDETKPFSLAPGAGEREIVIPKAEPKTGNFYEAETVAVEPVLVERINPIYPTRCELGAAAVETVEVAFNVTAQGVVAGARVATSSNSCFNDAALNAARRWRFTPPVGEGVAKPAYDLRYTFRFERPL